MGFNLGRFAAGAVQGGVQTYTTLKDIEQKEKEFALREEAAAREKEKYERELAVDRLLKEASAPEATVGTGESMSSVAGALPIAPKGGQYDTPEYRQAFTSALSKMTPEQQQSTLRQYGSVMPEGVGGAPAQEGGMRGAAVPARSAIDLGKAVTYKGDDGQIYVTDKTRTRSQDEIGERFMELAGKSGSSLAMEKAMDYEAKRTQALASKQALRVGEQNLEAGGYTIKGLKRAEERAKAEDDLSAWLTNTTTTLQEQGAQVAAEMLVKEYNTDKAHKDGNTAQIVKNQDGSTALVIKNDKTGKIVESRPVDNESISKAIEAMAFQKWAALPQNYKEGLTQKREDKKLKIEENRLGLEGERVEIARRQLDFEASRLGMEAGKLGLEWEKFNLEVKNNPTKMAEINAKINNYNADATYRRAAAKAASDKTGNWAVIGTDTDGAPISYNKNDGSTARPDGKPIKDIDFFKKVTGEKAVAVKEPITNKDYLEFVDKNREAPSGIKDKNTGRELRIGELPVNQQRKLAEEFYKGEGSGGLPEPDAKNMVKPGAVGADGKPASNPPSSNTKKAIPLTSTDGGKNYRANLPEKIRDPSVPYYREIPNPLAYLNNITFQSRAEAEKAYENAMKNDAAAQKLQDRTGIPQ
jgi:hypothetical protein